ncbi:MAG TPA: hypothetical protein V6C99_01825 [Oculatellaceae cyanobacterium]
MGQFSKFRALKNLAPQKLKETFKMLTAPIGTVTQRPSPTRFGALVLAAASDGVDITLAKKTKTNGNWEMLGGVTPPFSTLADEQVVLMSRKPLPELQPGLTRVPFPDQPDELWPLLAPPEGKMYSGETDDGRYVYSFRHPAVSALVQWLWKSKEGKKASDNEVRTRLDELVKNEVLEGVTDKEENPFVKALAPTNRLKRYSPSSWLEGCVLTPHQDLRTTGCVMYQGAEDKRAPASDLVLLLIV